jgi:hypothetical protein
MFTLTRLRVVGAGLLLTLSATGGATDELSTPRAEYEAIKATTASDAASQVRMAL